MERGGERQRSRSEVEEDPVTGERSLITEEVRALVGVSSGSSSFTVERLTARRLAEALGEDVDAVAEAEAPPSYYVAAFETQMAGAGAAFDLTGGVLAGDEWEHRRPLRWGEQITGSGCVADVYERFGGRHGQTVYLRYEWTFTDAAGDVVSVGRRVLARFPVDDVEEKEAP
jgi:hypothetical protein